MFLIEFCLWVLPQSFVGCEGKLRQTPISPRLRTEGREHNLLKYFKRMFMYQAEIIIIISIISRYFLPILFLRGVGVGVYKKCNRDSQL